MRVLFVFFCEPPTPFSASVAALAPVVRAAGHEPSCLSLPLASRIDDAMRAIAERRPDVVALTAMSRDWPGARALVPRVAREIGALVVVGGYHASLAPRDVAACEGVGAICIGEGERPLAALLAHLEAGGLDRSLPGLWVRGADGTFSDPIPSADPEPDIAALPRWDYEICGDVGAMLARGINTFGPLADRYLPARASRGCPYRCSYCSAPRWGSVNAMAAPGARNVRPVAHLADELAELRARWSPEGFEFWDEHFPIAIEWLRELARVLPRRVGLPFKVEMHPSAATRERLELLAEAGCVLFHCGVEAGDAELRRGLLARRTADDVLARVIEDARALGMETSASVMTALPGETYAQAMSTVALLRRLRPGSIMWSGYQPLPGTPLGEADALAPTEPARERFDDHRRAARSRPAATSEDERRAVHDALRALQLELVADAAQAGGAAGASDTAAAPRARPVAVPRTAYADRGAAAAPDPLASLLGVRASDAPPGHGACALRAGWQDGSLVVALALDGDGEGEARLVVLGPLRDDARYYARTRALGVAYRGADATPALLAAIDAIAARLDAAGTTMDDLHRAFPPPR